MLFACSLPKVLQHGHIRVRKADHTTIQCYGQRGVQSSEDVRFYDLRVSCYVSRGGVPSVPFRESLWQDALFLLSHRRAVAEDCYGCALFEVVLDFCLIPLLLPVPPGSTSSETCQADVIAVGSTVLACAKAGQLRITMKSAENCVAKVT